MSSWVLADCTTLASLADIHVPAIKAMRSLLFSSERDKLANLANVRARRGRQRGDDSHGFLGSSAADLMERELDGNETR